MGARDGRQDGEDPPCGGLPAPVQDPEHPQVAEFYGKGGTLGVEFEDFLQHEVPAALFAQPLEFLIDEFLCIPAYARVGGSHGGGAAIPPSLLRNMQLQRPTGAPRLFCSSRRGGGKRRRALKSQQTPA